MSSWEQTISRGLNALRLDTIRSKILMFAVLATLLPSITTAYVSYVENKRALQAKASEELLGLSAQAARELDLWTKERRYDLRVFSSSYEVTENIERIPRNGGQVVRSGRPYQRVTDYINSVRDRFPDYTELLALDAAGRVVASSERQSHPVALPSDWQAQMRGDNLMLGPPYWDSTAQRPQMLVAVPIRLASGRLLGAIAAKVNLRSVADSLKRFAPGDAGQVYLMSEEGQVIVSSRGASVDIMKLAYTREDTRYLLAREGRAVQFSSITGERVVGSVRRIPALNWIVVTEIPTAEAFRQVARLRNVTALIVASLFAAVGALGYFLGLLIVRPLDRLTQGAAKVAAGDLEVDLPVVTGGEVGYLTKVFNNMVSRLRETHQELERLSATDPLTGLFNRRRMMEALDHEVRRSRRLKHTFAVLMADVDHFKKYNDANGHPAGDAVLKKVGATLRECTRDVDVVARYGGEEFFVLMPETEGSGAADVADRVRERMAGEKLPGGSVTLSFGVAEFPAHGDIGETLIAIADAALYQAKREGRDRVVVAPGAAERRRRKSREA
ncbi:MAG TPA: diguanylate cyclase [Gemmatimonadales bacterium]|nr:diguanylate cyclase [Gemmatimonadales bacterium]